MSEINMDRYIDYNALLTTENLSKRYGSLYALNNVNITIGAGRIVGLLGPNGSGKTTLLKLAAGLLTPTEGQIRLLGEKPGVFTKSHVSYLPDRFYFDKWMRIQDCLDYFSDFFEDFDMDRAISMLTVLHLEPKQLYKNLSKGNKEKVQLILAMSRKALLYLLDEPIGGVDPATREYILNTILTNYNEQGTVIISTHKISDVEKILHDIIFLKEGVVERVTSVDDLREREGKSVDEVFREVFRC